MYVLPPTSSPRLCDVRVNVVCVRSVSHSVAQWPQLLSLAVLAGCCDVWSDWTTPAGWSSRLQAVDKREELLTGLRITGSKMERSWLTELVPSSLLHLETLVESLQDTEEAELISPVQSVSERREWSERRATSYNMFHVCYTEQRLSWEL